MLRLQQLFFFITLPVLLFGQEKSLYDLYENTMVVYEDIQEGEHLNALEKADEILGEYLHFPGGEKYNTYLYIYQAEAYLRLGDIMLSALCCNVAWEMAEKADENSLLFTIENNLAALDIEKQDYFSCFNKCRFLLEGNIYKPTKDQLGMVINNMALAAFKTNNYEAADSLFRRLFEISTDSFPNNLFDRYLPYRNYGLYLMQKGQEEEALEYFIKALNLYRDNLGENHYETLRSKLYMGDCLLKNGTREPALDLYNLVISALDPDSLEIRPSEYELLLIKSYLSRAGYWFDQENQMKKEERIHSLRTSLEDLDKAEDRILFMMQYYSAGESGFTLAKTARPVYDMAIEVSLCLYELNMDEEYFVQALLLSDKAKKLSLFARNLESRVVELSPSIEVLSRNLYKTRQTLASQIIDSEEFPSANNSQESLVDLLQEYSLDKIKLDSAYGFSSLHESKLHLTNETLNVFKRHPLISYHDQDSIFRVMAVLGKDYQEFRIKKTDELLNNIIAFKRILPTTRSGSFKGAEFNEFVELAGFLFNLLIEPIDFIRPGQTLFIQPDGDLLGLPFEILLPGDQKSTSIFTKGTFRDLPYIIKGNPVFYLSSIYSFKKSPEKA